MEEFVILKHTEVLYFVTDIIQSTSSDHAGLYTPKEGIKASAM